MADENTEVQEGEAPKSSSGGTIKLIIAGVAIIILAAGIAFGVAMLVLKSVPVGGTAAKGETGGKPAKSESLGTTFDAGEFITNLAAEGGNRFVKVNIVFSFQDTKVQTEIEDKLPGIKNAIISILRQQTPDSLAETKGMDKLADSLKKSVNALLVKGNITNVYFTTFQVQ